MDSFKLKIIAIIAMTCNHIAHLFMYSEIIPYELLILLYVVGGLTYPIMAFLLVEGFTYTSNIKRYLLRLIIFAILAQIPYMFIYGYYANILVTLSLSLVLLYAYKNIFIKSKPLFLLIFLIIEFLSCFCDWGVYGPIIPLLIYYFKNNNVENGVNITMIILLLFNSVSLVYSLTNEINYINDTVYSAISNQRLDLITSNIVYLNFIDITVTENFILILCDLGFFFVGPIVSMILLNSYNGKQGLKMKWFFYAYYPIHLIVIDIIYLLVSNQLIFN